MAVGRGLLAAASAWLAGVWLAGAEAPVLAQSAIGSVDRASLYVDLSRPGATAHVRLDYRLSLPAGVDRVPLTVLVAAPAEIAGVTARTPTRAVEVELPPSTTVQRSGSVHLPGAGPARALSLTIEYEVSRAIRPAGSTIHYRVPILAVDWPTTNPLPGTFRARARVQRDVWIYESFPTSLSGPLGPPGRSEWEVELSVVPSYLTLRGNTGGGPPLLSAPRVVDGTVLGLLAVLGLVGWLRLKESL